MVLPSGLHRNRTDKWAQVFGRSLRDLRSPGASTSDITVPEEQPLSARAGSTGGTWRGTSLPGSPLMKARQRSVPLTRASRR